MDMDILEMLRHAEHGQNTRHSRLARDAADEIAALRRLLRESELAIPDAERYRWLRKFYACADFDPGDHDGMDLIFSVPQGEASADCDKTIDGLMRGSDAKSNSRFDFREVRGILK